MVWALQYQHDLVCLKCRIFGPASAFPNQILAPFFYQIPDSFEHTL